MGGLKVVDTKGLGILGKAVVSAVQAAIGKIYEPTHVRRMARASADAQLIELRASEEHSRVSMRLQNQEVRRQKNIDAVVKIATIQEGTPSEKTVDEDWLWRFINLSQDVGSEEVQHWWGRILAGEVVRPGAFSPRTLSILSQLSQEDADVFRRFLTFVWDFRGQGVHFQVHGADSIMKASGIFPLSRMCLEDQGLLGGEASIRGQIEGEGDRDLVYFNSQYMLTQPGALPITRLTVAGDELRAIARPSPDFQYRDLVLHSLGKDGCSIRGATSEEVGRDKKSTREENQQ